MKTLLTKHRVFIGKSLLWSVLLYGIVTLVLDWEEVVKRKDSMPLVKVTEQNTVPHASVSMASIATTLWISVAKVIRHIH